MNLYTEYILKIIINYFLIIKINYMFVNSYCLPMNCIIAPLNGCGGIYLGNVDAA